MREKIKKIPAKIIGGIILAMLLIFNGATSIATPAPPTQPDPTECADCQTIQDDLDAAYADLETVVEDVSSYDIEGLLDQTATVAYGGDPLLMEDMLTSNVMDGYLASGSGCEDDSDSFAYYSSFVYEGTTYCLGNEAMWNNPVPDNFFDQMITISAADPGLVTDWQSVWDDMIDLLTDFNDDSSPNIEDILDEIAALLALLDDCEDTNCPAPPECPDCETIAEDLQTAMDDLADLEDQADELDAELTDLEDQIDEVYDQLDAWDQLRADFEQMVEDAGGMHGEDCDGFEVQSGQAWGIAHNFGDVQWCFTSEDQIKDMIDNLDEYWQTHSSQHLPSEAELNQELDTLMNDYIDKLDEYLDVLDAIEDAYDDIDMLAEELDDCLTELAALQAQGYCLDQDIGPMEDVLDEADDVLGQGYEPPEAAEGETPEEEPEEGETPDDIGGHWAEDFITELFDAGVVSGDDLTGLFRPDDFINRAEAAKIVTLGNGDTINLCDPEYFPDVMVDDWFCDYTTTAKDNGYFEGYPDGTFGPEKNIIRAEAAAVVLRVVGFNIPEYDEYTFPDITGDEWYADYAEKAYQCGIFEGRSVDGEQMFAGGEDITRAEFAKIVDITIFNDLDESQCADSQLPECPDCDAVWDELTTLGDELDTIGQTLEDLGAQMEQLQELQDAFRQMVEDAGGMTDADCDGFEVGPGQAMGVASAFGNVTFCLSSVTQIQDLNDALKDYWDNNSSQHLPSELVLQDQINQAMDDYTAKLDEYIEKLNEYLDCMDDLEALQNQGYCQD